MSLASELTNNILDFIFRQGGYAWRSSSTGIFDSKLNLYRTSPKKGVSDILAVHKSWLIACEIKIGKDRLSDEQIGFLKNIEHVGGVVMVVRSFEDFKMQWIGYLTKRGI